MKTINARLLFPVSISRTFVRFSRDIDSSYKLGASVPPHVTLFSYAADKIPELPRREFSVTLTGLKPMGDGAERLWVTIGVDPSPALLDLRKELLVLCGNPTLELDEFVPHVTLATVARAGWENVAARLEGYPLFDMENILCTVDCVAL